MWVNTQMQITSQPVTVVEEHGIKQKRKKKVTCHSLSLFYGSDAFIQTSNFFPLPFILFPFSLSLLI